MGIFCWNMFFLTGCPVPNPYRIFINEESNKLYPDNIFSSELYNHRISGAHPWHDSKRKIIIVNSSINNKSNQTLIIESDSIKLESKKEEFNLITDDMNLINPFKVDSTELTVKPNESSLLTLYFISKGQYTKREYKKSLKNDTLVLKIQLVKEKETFYLIQ